MSHGRTQIMISRGPIRTNTDRILAGRRRFLKAGVGLPAIGVGLQVRPADEPGPAHSSFDPWVEVHAGHLRANLAAVYKYVRRPVLAVIKNNGYGAGVLNVARALEPASAIVGFAVVKLQEAMALRGSGVQKPILLMGPVDDSQILDAARHRISLMVYTPLASVLQRTAAQLGAPIDIHVCVDTGLGRVGVPYRRASELIRTLATTPGVRVAGTMMTFTEDEAFDREQLQRFRTLLDGLHASGIDVGARHAASSYTLFQHPDAGLDMIRPGMVLYGVYPEASFRTSGVLELKPAVALKARVAYVKQLQPGESAGYNRAFIADRPVWVATLPVGHADGVPRTAAKGGRVRIRGALFPIIASVSASHTIVEIGGEQRVEIGDEATLFDWTDGSRPEDLAAACGASVYDLTMHLNPLLPRRWVG
jgi:alanine racemase